MSILDWLAERGRDVWLWPRILIRDGLARLRRLGETLSALPRREGEAWLADWLLEFVSRWFDLLGGPELLQVLWRLLTRTSCLTSAEIALAETIFGPEGLRYATIRIAQGGFLRQVFKRNKGRAFVLFHTVNLPEDGSHGRDNHRILIHELVHVCQYERAGSVYAIQALAAQWRYGAAAYDFGGAKHLKAARERGQRLKDFNREQQAQLVQEAFTLWQAGKPHAEFAPFVDDLRAGDV